MIVDNLILEKLIGKGSFGEVYLTSKKGDTKKYATKKFERSEIEGTEAMKYLKNEIIILQHLKHPNIAKYEDVKKTKKHFYIVMEFCNGGELSKALEKYQSKYGHSFPEEIVQHLMRQIINAFQYIHKLKIIHRDIKLDNILLNYETEEDKNNLNLLKATVKIIDFGFSCKISKTGLQYSTLGSPINMDPIILKKLNSTTGKTRQLGYDQKADIWSLGTICYEMLIGKSAFDAQDMDELVEKIEKGTYVIPTSVSKEVISFLNGMLQYESRKRLNCEQLAKHDFLTKNVKDFHKIDVKKVSGKITGEGLNINVKQNRTIWAIFNSEDENKLTKIGGTDFTEPIEEKDELESKNSGPCPNESFPMENQSAYSGPMLPNPFQGIPGNPTNQQIKGSTEQEIAQGGFVCKGGIFD
jgi:serine/threonine protein kinase